MLMHIGLPGTLMVGQASTVEVSELVIPRAGTGLEHTRAWVVNAADCMRVQKYN